MNKQELLSGAIEQTAVALRFLYALRGYMDAEQEQKNTSSDVFEISGTLDATLNKEQQCQNGINPELLLQGDADLKNVTLRKDGRFMIRYQVNGKRATGYARTLAEARSKIAQIKKKALRSEQQQSRYTVSQWVDIWFKTYKEPFVKPSTAKDMLRYLDLIKTKIGGVKLTQFTTTQAQAFINELPLSRTKELIIMYSNAIFQKAFDVELVKRNVFKNVVKDKKIKNVRPPFSLDEQGRILGAVKGTRLEPYILFYILTGVRKNEIPGNMLEALDVENNRIKVINEKQRALEQEYKYIDLNPNYVKLLQQQAGLFTLTTEVVYREFSEVLAKLKIKGTLHTLRHTFATNYYYWGVPEKVIQGWMGHKTLNITQDIYIGFNVKNPKDELSKLYNNLLYEF